MPERLFAGSWHAAWQDTLRRAADDVLKLDRKLFSDPALGGHLKKIADKYSVEIARIIKDGIRAKRRETERDIIDGWGERRRVKQTWLDVTIPFSGEAESFKIAPSRPIIPSNHSTIGANALTLTIPDDESAQGTVDTFVAQISQNLDALRAEYEQSKGQLEQIIQNTANQRKQQIEAERARDQKLNFPVLD